MNTSSTRSWWRLAGLALTVIVLAAFAPSALARTGDSPKPDLVITNAQAGGSQYTFKGVDSTLTVHYATKNKGRHRAGRSSSVTALVPEFAGSDPRKYADRAGGHRVPELGSGDSDRSGDTFDFSTDNLPLGAYD